MPSFNSTFTPTHRGNLVPFQQTKCQSKERIFVSLSNALYSYLVNLTLRQRDKCCCWTKISTFTQSESSTHLLTQLRGNQLLPSITVICHTANFAPCKIHPSKLSFHFSPPMFCSPAYFSPAQGLVGYAFLGNSYFLAEPICSAFLRFHVYSVTSCLVIQVSDILLSQNMSQIFLRQPLWKYSTLAMSFFVILQHSVPHGNTDFKLLF